MRTPQIESIDTSKAKALPGVLAVLTGGDIKRMSEPMPTIGGVEDLKSPEHTAIAVDQVNSPGRGSRGSRWRATVTSHATLST